MDVEVVGTQRRVTQLAGLVREALGEPQQGAEWAEAMHQHLLLGRLMPDHVNDAIAARAARTISPVTTLGREYLERIMGRKAPQVLLLSSLGIAWQAGVLLDELRRWLFDRNTLDRGRVGMAALAIIGHAQAIVQHVEEA